MGIEGRVYYNGDEVRFVLPKSWNLLAMAEPKEVPGVKNIGDEVERALRNPIGMDPLATLIAGERRTVAIISEDQTRPSPVGSIAKVLIDELMSFGVKEKNIRIVMGRGTHTVPSQGQLEKKLGRDLLNRFEVSIHDPDDQGRLVNMGTTKRGTSVLINSVVAESDIRIGIGTINPHYFAGYGGGAKIVLPGVSGRQTIVHNHVLIRDPNTVPGKMDGNPIWEDMLDAARIAGLTMKLDVLLNTRNEVYRIFAGEVEAQQKTAVKDLLAIYGVPVPRQADITITSGYPLESDLIQSGKALLQADFVTKPGGSVILVSACPDGPGPLFYETMRERPEPNTVIDWIEEGKASPTGGPMASRCRNLLKTKKLVLVTDGIPVEKIREMAMDFAPSVEAAIGQTAEKYPKPDVVILPIGGSTFPYIQ